MVQHLDNALDVLIHAVSSCMQLHGVYTIEKFWSTATLQLMWYLTGQLSWAE